MDREISFGCNKMGVREGGGFLNKLKVPHFIIKDCAPLH